MSLELRPVDRSDPEDRRRYVAGLDAAFNGWGDDARFRWAFDRACGAGSADLVVLVDESGLWVAGSAVTHRLIGTPAGDRVHAGIMTGSWTLAEARGRGCFTDLIQWSLDVVHRSSVGVLLAFVTDTNASRRRLEASGAATVPTWYMVWPTPSPTGAPSAIAVDIGSAAGLPKAAIAERAGVHHVAYPDAEAWLAQLIDRPDPVDVVEVPGGWAVIERAPTTDRALAVISDGSGEALDPVAVLGSLTGRAADHARQLFAFTTDPAWAEAARATRADVQPGRLTVLGDTTVAEGPWRVGGGDRM